MRLDRKRARKLRRKQKDICTAEDEHIYEVGGWMSRRRYRQIRGSREAYATKLFDRAEKPHRTSRRNTRDIRHQRTLEEQELKKRTAEYSRISRSRRRELMQDKKPVMQKLYESVKSGHEAQVSIDSNSQPNYREKLNAELKALHDSEMWRTGEVVRKLRPENN